MLAFLFSRLSKCFFNFSIEVVKIYAQNVEHIFLTVLKMILILLLVIIYVINL